MTSPPPDGTGPAPEAVAAGAAAVLLQRRVTGLVESEAAGIAQVSGQLVGALRRLWGAVGNFYDDDAAARFGERAGKLVTAAQKTTGQITEQHLRRQLTAMRAPIPRGVVVDLPTDLRSGALTVDVYVRPVRTVRYLRSVDADDAEGRGLKRLEELADTDLQLAHTTAAQQVMYGTSGAVTGYRRVIHPEISGRVCGLCIVASDRVYHRENLQPLHPGCHCTVLPVVGALDPGAKVNAADLRRIYAAAGSTDSKDLARTRVEVLEHGELGPVLVARPKAGAGTRRDAGDAERDSSPAAVRRRERTLRVQRDDLQRRLSGARQGSSSARWLQDRIASFDALIAS